MNSFCPSCGAKIKEKAKFCGDCGSQIESTNTYHSDTSNQKEDSVIFKIIGMILFLLGLYGIISGW